MEETIYTLFYENYRGYTIFSTAEGRCCIHGKHGCIKLRGRFVCFPDVEEARTLIKRFRTKGYTSPDRVERYLPQWEFVCLNWREQQRTPMPSRHMRRVSQGRSHRGRLPTLPLLRRRGTRSKAGIRQRTSHEAANAGKLAALNDLAQMYLPLCQRYVTLFCTEEQPDKFRDTCSVTPLSERWHQVAIRQAAGIARAFRTNREQDYLDDLLDFHEQEAEDTLDAEAKEPA